jgi:phenylacetate-CoA ligase
VLTSLHNFATPLIRYEIGDYAELGPPCSCGRGLPVLRRVLGRVRNMLVTASGERYWPTFGLRSLGEAAPVRQAQFVQKSHSLVEARLVLEAPLTAEQSAKVSERLLERLPPGFEVRVLSVDWIERGAGGKFEDFLSEIPRAEP